MKKTKITDDSILAETAETSGPSAVYLVKKDTDGNIIDEISLPEATWANLPSGTKKLWQLKTPAELDNLNKNKDEANQ